MKKNLLTRSILLLAAILLSGCITVEVPEEQPLRFLEVVMITYTPAVSATPQPATATSFIPTDTQAPSETPHPTATETLLPSPTPTESLVQVLLNANCRSGPGTVYPVVGYLFQGNQVRLEGRSESGVWWLVAPGTGRESCWVTGQALALSGFLGDVAVLSAPPAPTRVYAPTQTAVGREPGRPGGGGGTNPTQPPATQNPYPNPPTAEPATPVPYP